MSMRATFEVSYVVSLINIIEKTERERDEAEAQGYERGVKEAAEAMKGLDILPIEDKADALVAILALLEKPKEKTNATD